MAAPIRETRTLWIHSVPPKIAASVSDQEKKRQEAINEVIYTERDFVRDMEYLRDCWVKPLRTSDIVPESRRIHFIQQVFRNLDEIIAVNIRLRDALSKRQKSYAIVDSSGRGERTRTLVRYGSHQLYEKLEVEKEKSSNAAFAQFVEETERLPEARKLELNIYLTKPSTHLARYPLMLEVVLKYTSDDNPDKATLVEVVKIIRGFLKRANEESEKAESRLNLLQLDQQLVFQNVEQVDLRLRDENRELLFKGTLQRRGGQGDNGNLQVFLFDHALLMVKAKTKHEQFRVYKRPIPLELLVVTAQEESASSRSATKGSRQAIIRRNSFSKRDEKDRENGFLPLPLKSDSKNGYPITFMHLGRKGYVLTLSASTVIGRKKWLEKFAKQQEVMRERSMTFDTLTLSEGFFFGENKVNCAAPFNHGSQLAQLLQGGNDTLRVFKEFYIPTESSSIHFLKTKLCVGCTKGFEIVDLETLDTQGLLDPADPSLDFVQKRENTRPIAIYRIENEFLLCYDARTNHPRQQPSMPLADTPPSTKHSAANYAYTNPYVRGNPYIYPQPPGHAQSLPPPGAWLQPQYGDYPGAAYGMPPPFHRNQPYTRDEIIIVSDDKVMAVRLASPRA
ncbi:RHO1 GDP-GTP exchange protein 2 [Tulasnella sp. 424]|nr:RHO1 GDP-GTP exchange protein 2 [Tulasnella sp. 424]